MRFSFFLLLLTHLIASSQVRNVMISGDVYAEQTHIGLVGAKVYLIDSVGCVVDSTIAKSQAIYGSNIVTTPQFQFRVPYSPSVYTIEASYPSYESGFRTVDLRKLGRRENSYKIPSYSLKKEAKMLEEVTVTASAVKFYNKGDTLVFNANAFQLADGSMLDALIRQLPGVELKDNGQIFVNGKFVESLMLNGRDFIGDNKQLLLNNLGAYTVKDVAVYDKASDREKFIGKDLGESSYVMDVRMKKEFLGTYILNLEGGYGTADRYMGRAFGMRASATSQIMFAGAINNINDARRPGQATSWKPEDLESGDHKEKLLRADYSFNAPDQTWKFSGNTILKHSSVNDEIDTDEMTFLPSGVNYRYAFNHTRRKNLWLGTAASYNRTLSQIMLSGDVTAQYIDFSNKNQLVSATFNRERVDATRELLEKIYDSGNIELSGIVNRNLQTDSTSNRTFRIFGHTSSVIKIPHTSDNMVISVGADYTNESPVRFNDQLINYGSNSIPAVRNTQYYRNSPLHSLNLNGMLNYTYWFTNGYFQPQYEFSFDDKTKDSRLYQLDRLADNSIYGVIPPDYEEYYAPDNSYHGLHRQYSHKFIFGLAFPIGKLSVQIKPSIQPIRQTLHYTQNNHTFRKSRNSVIFGTSMSHIVYRIGEYRGSYGMQQFVHTFDLELKANGFTPDMTWLVDMPYTADPLNITSGADRLKNEQHYGASLSWKFSPKNSRLMETVVLSYENICDMLVRGFRYDTATGVRTIKSYNVNGNWNSGVENILSIPIKKVMFSSNTSLNYGHAADMIGRDAEPTPYRINNLYLSEKITMQYSPAKWLSFTAKSDFQWRRTTSNEHDFSRISAFNNNTGITALFKLPQRFQISTDCTIYTRRGYGSPELNTTDCVWNARLAWTTKNNKWLLTLDGFDMLKQLSSITYSINNQGRTITHMNVLPRYMMLHVQYKLNILPRHK